MARMPAALLAIAALVIAPAAEAAKPGKWSGKLYGFSSKKADKGSKLSFRVKGKRLRGVKIRDRSYRCVNVGFDPADDTFDRVRLRIRSVPVKGRRIAFRREVGSGFDSVTFVVKGKIGKRKARGTLAVYGHGDCSKNWRWKAMLRR